MAIYQPLPEKHLTRFGPLFEIRGARTAFENEQKKKAKGTTKFTRRQLGLALAGENCPLELHSEIIRFGQKLEKSLAAASK